MAAGARRSLTYGFTLISRRFHPSLSDLLPSPHDRQQPVPQPSPNPQSPFRSPILTGSRNLGFAPPLGLASFLRSYSSSSGAVGESGEIGFIERITDALTDPSYSAAVAPAPFPGEVAAAAADSFPPVAALQHLIDLVHSVSGTNWWLSIALTTILIRGLTLPLMINQMRTTGKFTALRPEIEALKQKMQNTMDPETKMENQKQMLDLFRKHGVSPVSPMKGMFIQGPLFIGFFMAISNMAEKVASLQGGGAFWFTDLTTPDPFYALPILNGLTFLATVECNMQQGMEGNPIAGTMKKFLRVVALVSVPFTVSFPKALFCYWITTNIFSLTYGFAIRQTAVKKVLNLPDLAPAAANTSPTADVSLLGPTKLAPVVKAPKQRISFADTSQQIKNLEKRVKSRKKPKRR